MAMESVLVRTAASRADLDGIGRLDISYSTGRIYRVRRADFAFWLDEEVIDPPVTKANPRPSPELSVNYPAVQFYLRMGFRLCGLDQTLYREADPHILPGEVALYFTRDLPVP